jgi:hypothetical protein
MKDCPFCGHKVDTSDPDTIYPNGVGWVLHDGTKSYVNFREVSEERWCYSINCVTTSGGCGAEMAGDSLEECIEKWNRRIEERIRAEQEQRKNDNATG